MNQQNDLKVITLNIAMLNKKLEYITKQLDKNRIKYPIGMTYDQLYANIFAIAKEDIKRDFNIVRTA